jgi:hypothetical protein
VTDGELRAIVRDVLARRAAGAEGPGMAASPAPAGRAHPSHALFRLPAGAEAGGQCVIEPAVLCTHCGYCKSYGH